MRKTFVSLLIAGFISLGCVPANAVTTVFYGDDDGFGVGANSGVLLANNSNASPGEAPLTDVRLIGDFFDPLIGFRPTGSFTTFAPLSGITSAILTLRLGSFTPLNPVDGPSAIFLNGLEVDSNFLNSFGANLDPQNRDNVETRSIALSSSFFSSLSTGSVSLAGTRISEGSGFGSFQVDFLRLDITGVSAVPEPSTWAMLVLGFGLIGGSMRSTKRKNKIAATYA